MLTGTVVSCNKYYFLFYCIWKHDTLHNVTCNLRLLFNLSLICVFFLFYLDNLKNGQFHQHLRETFAPMVVRYVDLMESSIAQSIHKGFEKERWENKGLVWRPLVENTQHHQQMKQPASRFVTPTFLLLAPLSGLHYSAYSETPDRDILCEKISMRNIAYKYVKITVLCYY